MEARLAQAEAMVSAGEQQSSSVIQTQSSELSILRRRCAKLEEERDLLKEV
jgi:hypothetical protein